MSGKIDRREFILRSVGSLAGLTLAGTFSQSVFGSISGAPGPAGGTIDRVPLGATGLTVSRMAMGTGTVGGGQASNQTRLGQEAFTALVRHGYERGVRFADMAESYGSMPFMGRAIEGLPRENITLLSKIWTHADDSERIGAVRPKIEEYLRLLGTDYIDIVLMHCMTAGDWNTTRTHYMEGLSRAKEDGLIRSVGVSCHNIDALLTAASSPWVEVIMARINPFGSHMDGPVADVRDILHTARANGKGLIGMKIFGEGRNVAEHEREESIRHAIRDARVHALTLGLQSTAQMDDAIEKVQRLAVND